jgi:hypothetical protein
MAPRKTKGLAYVLKELYELENVPEEERDTDEYVKLTMTAILKRIEKAKKKDAPVEVEEEGQYRAWSAFRG